MRVLAAAALSVALAAAASGAEGAAQPGVIVFTSTRVDGQSTDIWVLGSRLRRLTVGVGDDNAPALSPDRQTVVFVSRGSPPRTADGRLVLINRAGGTVRPMFGGLRGSNPAWAPDGKRIAYQRRSVIFIADLVRQRTRKLVQGEHPAWSRNGKSIAFVRGNGRARTIRTIRPDGTGERVVASVDTPVLIDLAWSLKGRSIAYSTHNTITILSTTDASRRTLVSETENRLSSPTWSPDGRTLAYASGWAGDKPDPTEARGAHFLEIWTVDVATGRRTALIRGPGDTQNLAPDWR